MPLQRSFALFAAAIAVVAFSSIASAARLDPPVLTLAESSRSSVTLEVRAGASGAPAGFTLVWMKRTDYERTGWLSPGSTGVVSATFYGFPTFNMLDGTVSYVLPPNGTQVAEAGNLFDETGVLMTQALELEAGTDYVFHAFAATDGYSMNSGYSNDVSASTSAPTNCTYTQGYWKNHTSAWPVTSLTIGTVTYTKSQLLQILATPARGNGLLILAHQLIAAKLNVYQGADPTDVNAAIASADAIIGGLVCPPIGGGYLDPALVTGDAQTLDDFNNGTLGVPHCGTVPTRRSTWGALKAIYR